MKYLNVFHYLLAIVICLTLVQAACQRTDTEFENFIVLEGQEDTAVPIHMLALETGQKWSADTALESDIQSRIDQVGSLGGLAVIVQPDLFGFTNAGKLASLQGYLGIELDLETDNRIWDAVLTQRLESGQPLVWGFAGDDFHYPMQLGLGFIAVKTAVLDKSNLIDALRAGAFCWGNTALIESITTSGDTLSVGLLKPAEIHFICSGGQVAGQTTGLSADYQVTSDEGYIRIEARTAHGEIAGTQPFAIDPVAGLSNPYSSTGQWYKGNLHTHTTLSDGRLSPDQVRQLYSQNGYSFIAFTDHVPWTIPVQSEASIQGQLIIDDGRLAGRTAWIGAAVEGQMGYVSVTSLKIDSPGVYDYTIPYLPEGTYTVEAIVTDSGYYLPADSQDLLALGTYPYGVVVDNTGPFTGIDFSIDQTGSS